MTADADQPRNLPPSQLLGFFAELMVVAERNVVRAGTRFLKRRLASRHDGVDEEEASKAVEEKAGHTSRTLERIERIDARTQRERCKEHLEALFVFLSFAAALDVLPVHGGSQQSWGDRVGMWYSPLVERGRDGERGSLRIAQRNVSACRDFWNLWSAPDTAP